MEISSYVADWAPKRLKLIKRAVHDTIYEALRAESRDISVSYNGLDLQALVELRTKDNCIRVMLKVSTPPDGKVCEAGSYALQVS